MAQIGQANGTGRTWLFAWFCEDGKMASMIKDPKRYDSRWVLFAILGVNLGLFPVFALLVITRLNF